jgi:hypothetical protein
MFIEFRRHRRDSSVIAVFSPAVTGSNQHQIPAVDLA